MVRAETQYLDLLRDIRDNGEQRGDRTGTGTRSIFGRQLDYDLRKGAPILTSKRVALGAVAHELVWMLHGDSNIKYLAENNVKIWNEWAFEPALLRMGYQIPEQGSEEWDRLMELYINRMRTDDRFANMYGDLGPVYGYQWRHAPKDGGGEVDQIADVQDALRHNPFSRRLIVDSWNVGQIDQMALPPCHLLYQFYSSTTHDPESGKPYLDMKMYQRSADMFLGVPFNMAQYAMLLTMMAQATDHEPRILSHTFGDTHIYNNHGEQVDLQLSRADDLYPAPRIELNPDIHDITKFTRADINIVGYESHPAIRAQVSI